MSVNIKKNGALIKLAGLYDSINLRLSQLLDTDISSLEDGQILAYNNETEKWENQEAPAGVEVVDNLTTQSATSALSANQGYVLNNALAGKANAVDVLSTLITSPANKQILSYDSSSSKWVNTANENTVLLGTVDPAVNLGKEGDIYVKLSSSSYGSSYRIYTTGTGGETANITVQTIINGTVTNSDTIFYRQPNRTYPDFTTTYKNSNWTVTITSNNVYGKEQGSTISWVYYQTNDVTLTINPPSVYGIFVKSRGIWIQIGKSPVEVVDNLTTQDATKALSANQGYALKGLIDGKSDVFLITMTEDENDNTSYVVDKTFEEILAAVEAGKFVMLKYDYSETNEGEYYHEEYDYRNYYTLTSTEKYDYYDDEDESNNYFTYEFDFNSYEYHDDYNLKYAVISSLDLSYDSFDESWFVNKHQDTGDYSAVGQIWTYNNQYQCNLKPNALSCAVLSKFSTIFLKCTIDDTMYHLTYADTINDIYNFSTIIKDNSNDFKLRTFVLTASGNSWTSITMNEIPIVDSTKVIKWSDASTSVKKNLLNNERPSTISANGLTFKINEDKSVTITGTATAATYFSFYNNGHSNDIGNGNYIISQEGCTSKVRAYINMYLGTTYVGSLVSPFYSESEKSFTVAYDNTYDEIQPALVIDNGATVNTTVKVMIRLASISDATYEPYIPDNTELVRYTDNSILGAKNLLPTNITNRTNAGITVTVNSDGGINVSGTATEAMSIDVCNYFKLPLGDYILTGTPYGGSQAQFKLLLVRDDSGIGDDIGNGYRFSVTSASANYRVQIRIPSEMVGVAGNKTFYPMIRLASDTDNTYAPYSKTNIELTNSVDWGTENILGAKNLLPNCLPPTSFTKNGITFTKNSDGSITCEGTATDDMWVGLYKYSSTGNSASGDCFLKEGKYTLSGCPTGGGTTAGTYRMYFQVRNSTDTGEEASFSDLGNSVTFDITSTYASRKCRVIIAIRSGCDLTTPVTFYPMIRYASIRDTTYEPYSMSNVELTNEVEKSYGRTYTLYMAGDSSKDMDAYTKSLGITSTITLRQMCELLSNSEKNQSVRIIINTNHSGVTSNSSQIIRDLATLFNDSENIVATYVIDVIQVGNGRLTITKQDRELTRIKYIVLNNWSTYKSITTPIEFYLDQTATTSTSTDTVYTFTDSRITSSSAIDVYADIFGVSPSNVVTTAGSCTVTFPKQSTAQSMTCRIYIK